MTETELTLEDVTISNSGLDGIHITAGMGSALHLRDTRILDATSDGIDASPSEGKPMTIEGSAISGSGGAGVFAPGFRVTVRDSTISGNTLEGLVGSDLDVSNSTISGNGGAQIDCTIDGGSYGGGGDPSCAVTHSTIASNAGVAILDAASFTSSIVEGSCAAPGQSLGGNLEGPGNTCGFDAAQDLVNLLASELDLGPLQDNGGPTLTHALLEDSLALSNAALATCPAADQRGEPRPSPAFSPCDSGAYEHQTLPEPGFTGLLAGAALLAGLARARCGPAWRRQNSSGSQ